MFWIVYGYVGWTALILLGLLGAWFALVGLIEVARHWKEDPDDWGRYREESGPKP